MGLFVYQSFSKVIILIIFGGRIWWQKLRICYNMFIEKAVIGGVMECPGISTKVRGRVHRTSPNFGGIRFTFI